MKRLLLIPCAVLCLICWADLLSYGENLTADKNPIVTDSTRSVIDIGLTYKGDSIHLFGTMEGLPSDHIVVKLTSPAETVKLNIKGRVGPLWMNTKQYQVENVPSMYKIHASAPLKEILPPQLAAQLGLGFDTLKGQLKSHIIKGTEDKEDFNVLFDGIMQIKGDANLYKIDDEARVEIKDGKLFNHYFSFPPDAKAGTYNVETFLIRDKKLVAKAKDTITIQKVGLEAFVARMSKERPVLYGICAVIIALGTGLLVGFVFKGGAH